MNYKNFQIKSVQLLICLFLCSTQLSLAQTEKVLAGSYIIDMGVTPQTFGNGLKTLWFGLQPGK